MCGPRSPEAPCSARGCRAPGTGLLLLSYLAYLVLGAGVFWALEGRAARYSSHIFQRDKWERLKNFTRLDDPALDQLIRVRGLAVPPWERSGWGRRQELTAAMKSALAPTG